MIKYVLKCIHILILFIGELTGESMY